jgi:sarcosine oxidase subunit beta
MEDVPRRAGIVIVGGGALGTCIAATLADAGVTDVVLLRVGYLLLLRHPEQLAQMERSVKLQNALGVASRILTPAEARALAPVIGADRYVAVTYCPDDGHARPRAAVAAWSDRARRASVELAVRPLRRQIAFTEPRPGGHPRLPFTIDLETSAYFHNAGDGLLVGYSDPEQAVGFDVTYDEGWLDELRRLIGQCAPALAGLPFRGDGWAGLYEMTPDANALIGEASDVDRFLYATGFSGHGFSQAPAAAEIIRDLILGRPPFVDVAPLRASRFAEGAPIREATIV